MGKIKIKEENKSKFSAYARQHGMTVQQMANTILRNREKYSPTMIKRANFARNAARWDEGGKFSVDNLPRFSGGASFVEALSDAGEIASMVSGPFGLAIQTGQMIGNAIGGGKRRRKEAALAEEQRITGVDMAQDQAQAGIINDYPTTFKFGGQFKGKKFGGKPNAIIGGGELLLSPDGIITDAKGPSDINGGPGIPAQLANGTKIINKKDSKDILPIASKANKSLEVLSGGGTKLAKNSATHNYIKYIATFDDVYNKQEAKKMAKGGKFNADDLPSYGGGTRNDGFTVGDSWRDPSKMFLDPYQTDFNRPDFNTGNPDWYKPLTTSNFVNTGNNIPQYTSDNSLVYTAPNDQMDIKPELGSLNNWQNSNVKFSNPADDPNIFGFKPSPAKGKDKFGWDTVGDLASGLGELAPMLYNLGQGLFGKREYMNAKDYANPYEGSINSLMANRRYNIDAPLAQNEAAFRTTGANLRNLGGSRGQVMGNLIGAQNTKQFGDMALYGQKNNMDNQYRGEQANMQYGLGRDSAMTRMSVDEGNAMTRVAGRNMTGSAMTGLQQYLLTRRQMKNQSKQEKLLLDVIKAYSPYTGKWIPGLDTYNKK